MPGLYSADGGGEVSEFASMILDLALAGWIGARKKEGRIERLPRLGGYGWDDYENVIRSNYEQFFFSGSVARYHSIEIGRVTDFGGKMWLLRGEEPIRVNARVGRELLVRPSQYEGPAIHDRWILFGFVPLDGK